MSEVVQISMHLKWRKMALKIKSWVTLWCLKWHLEFLPYKKLKFSIIFDLILTNWRKYLKISIFALKLELFGAKHSRILYLEQNTKANILAHPIRVFEVVQISEHQKFQIIHNTWNLGLISNLEFFFLNFEL